MILPRDFNLQTSMAGTEAWGSNMGWIYRFGDYCLDCVNQTFTSNRMNSTLRPKQFAVLEYLLRNAGRLVTKDELLDAAWADVAVGDGVLKVCIAELRRLLDDTASPPAYIETVHRRGYKFIASVSREERPPEAITLVTQPAPESYSEDAHLETLVGTGQSSTLEAAPSGVATAQEMPANGNVGEFRGKWRLLVSVGVVVVLSAVVMWVFLPRPLPRVTGSKQITQDGKELCCLVTDGARLYYNKLTGLSQDATAEVALAGGQVLESPSTLKNARILAIAPDHAQLLISSFDVGANRSTLWTRPLPTGAARRLGDIEGDLYLTAAWSPDGHKLLFVKGPELWIGNADGSQSQRIVAVNGQPQAPAFSPDGKRIRFTLMDQQAHTFALWEVRLDGSNLHPLLPRWQETPHQCCGIWTRDGRYFLFRTSISNEDFGDIYALRDSVRWVGESPKPVQLTFGPMRFELGPTTLDDKKLLVAGFDPRGELVRYDPATGRFAPYLQGIAATQVAFSRDGTRIAYISLTDETLWVSRTDGSERVQLTFTPEHAGLPKWSPDGSRITYLATRLGRPWKARVISAQGGTPEVMLPGSGMESDPSWSPDGTRIVFATGEPGATAGSDIRLFDVKTRQVSVIPGSEGRFGPRWSPDGQYLAALKFGPSSKQLFLYDVQEGRWTEWISDAESIAYPAWTADGQYVEYMNPEKCRRVRRGSNQPEDVFMLKDFSPFFGNFGPWNDNTPDGSRMFTRDSSTEDIYALDLDLP